jgi:hypothetical protein
VAGVSAAVVVVEKRCPKCGQTKVASDFYRNRSNSNGLSSECKPCTQERVAASAKRRRAEMGEEAWKEHVRRTTERSRERRGMKRERVYSRAQYQARQELIDAHREEYEARLKLALDALEREST